MKKKEIKQEKLLVDIDGTIANGDHRLPLITGEKKEWDKYFEACDKDTPIVKMIEFISELSTHLGYQIYLVTGRPERIRKKTEKWLIKHAEFLAWTELYMRKDGDHRKDTETKKDIVDEFFNTEEILMAIDDRPRVIRMYKELGINTLDVGKNIEF